MSEEGSTYAPKRFKNLVKERYLISKHTNTSYKDTDTMTPVERQYILEFIEEELRKQNEIYEKAKAKMNNK